MTTRRARTITCYTTSRFLSDSVTGATAVSARVSPLRAGLQRDDALAEASMITPAVSNITFHLRDTWRGKAIGAGVANAKRWHSERQELVSVRPEARTTTMEAVYTNWFTMYHEVRTNIMWYIEPLSPYRIP